MNKRNSELKPALPRRESKHATPDNRLALKGSHTRADSEIPTLRGLSGKLLFLTVLFVMLAEVLILVPSVANFRNTWLQSHLDTAEAASIVYLDATDSMLSPKAQVQLLKSTDALSVALREDGMSRLMAADNGVRGAVELHIDLENSTGLNSISSALSTMFFGGDRVLRVFNKMNDRQGTIELVQEERHLRNALITFARNVMLISLVISFITASLVFLSLYYLIVRPIRRMSMNMVRFSDEPENASLILNPSERADELGVAERRLADFQLDLQSTLRQKQHLADLGLAVSKINHDLRNILASAQLFSDRLSTLSDPTVQRFAPKLIRTIDRAVDYTKSVISYGKALESPPARRLHRLHAIVDEVGELLGVENLAGLQFINKVPHELEVSADSEQLFRVIMNLCRNAINAMQADAQESSVARLTVEAMNAGENLELRVCDTGPGIPPNLHDQLFEPFHGSASKGGTGLGLAIARELVRAHGGEISLEKTGHTGTVFLISIPANCSINPIVPELHEIASK